MDQPNLPQDTPPVLSTSTLALVSLIAGIVGLLFLPVVGGIVAIVTANMARRETRSVPPTRAGDSLATAGMVMGWLSLLWWVLVCCLVIASLALGAFGWFHTR